MIFIPKKIKVGYQKRANTYTNKLAYVIYYDNKNKLRKETSWENWRDKGISPDEFDNKPISGFVLNKVAGGIAYSRWESRKTYCRVYDPRGFEIEIDISNLLYILENTNSIVGKGLEGEFVYGWGGTDLILIPTTSHDYKEILEESNILHNEEYLKPKDLEEGKVYRELGNDNAYLYAGKRKIYKHESIYYRGNLEGYVETPKQHVFFDLIDGELRYDYLNSDNELYNQWAFKICTTIPKIVKTNDEYHPNYAEGLSYMEKYRFFVPDKDEFVYKKVKIKPEELEDIDLRFSIGRNQIWGYDGYLINSEIKDGVKYYWFTKKERHWAGHWAKGPKFTADKFIKYYWLKKVTIIDKNGK